MLTASHEKSVFILGIIILTHSYWMNVLLDVSSLNLIIKLPVSVTVVQNSFLGTICLSRKPSFSVFYTLLLLLLFFLIIVIIILLLFTIQFVCVSVSLPVCLCGL